MKPKVYIETSVISYLTSRPSRDLVAAARQETTLQWFEQQADNFLLLVSELVVEEAGRGNPEAAGKRFAVMKSVEVVPQSESALELADLLVESGAVPEVAGADALHIALAAAGNSDYLLTWNCKHIANAIRRKQIHEVLRDVGWVCPIICTPDELLEA